MNVQAVEERAEQIQNEAADVSKSSSAAATADKELTNAAPEEDLGHAVLQGAGDKLEGQSQVWFSFGLVVHCRGTQQTVCSCYVSHDE